MTIRESIISTIAIIALCSAIYGWYNPRIEYQPDGTVITLPQKTVWRLKDCTLVPPVGHSGDISSPTVTLASSDVPKCPEGGKLVTTFTPSTGEIHTNFDPKERHFMSFEDSKEIGLRYNGIRAGMYGRWTFARVGNIYSALYASADTKPDAFIGLEVSYRW